MTLEIESRVIEGYGFFVMLMGYLAKVCEKLQNQLYSSFVVSSCLSSSLMASRLRLERVAAISLVTLITP